jgi:hypothetical protein
LLTHRLAVKLVAALILPSVAAWQWAARWEAPAPIVYGIRRARTIDNCAQRTPSDPSGHSSQERGPSPGGARMADMRVSSNVRAG